MSLPCLLALVAPLPALVQDVALRPLHALAPAPQHPSLIALADLDADGDPDALTLEEGRVGAYENDGEGLFRPFERPLTLQPPYGGYLLSAASADLDGDGLDDFVLHDVPYLNQGDGTFVATRASSSVPITDVELGDVDGDGSPDIVLAGPAGSLLLLNDGAGTFRDESARLPFSRNGEIALADVDQDGDLDLLRGRSTLLNDGTGHFQELTLALPAHSVNEPKHAADANGDGYPDVFVCAPNSVVLLLGDGTGLFPKKQRLAGGGRACSVGDVDGDGDVDVLSVAPPLLLLGDGTGGFVDASASLPPGRASAVSLALGDLDRDGDLDALAVHADALFAGLATEWLGNGRGQFIDSSTRFPVGTFSPLALADVDGDGDLDALGYGPDVANAALRNDGSGVLVPAPELFTNAPPTAGNPPTDLAVGDLDGNGSVDLLWTRGGGEQLHLRGADGFRDASQQLPTPTPNRFPLAVALLDADDDGDLDAFVHGAVLWKNDGTATFTEDPSASPVNRYDLYAITVGDVDLDGDLDVYAGGYRTDTLLLGDGLGRFQDASAQLPTRPSNDYGATFDVALGDLDGDGDLDAFVGRTKGTPPGGYEGGYLPGPDELLLNDGSGVFALDPSFVSAVEWTVDVELGDFDGDGDLDAIAGARDQRTSAGSYGGNTRVYENDGGRLRLDPRPRGQFDANLVVGDLDGDSDADVLGSEGLLTNVTRQLAWRTLPRAGRRLTLDLWGPPNGTWRLFAASRSAIVATDLGPLRLDRAALLHAFAGTLDDTGRASLSVAVPDALVGETLFWQALVGTPLRFTNLEPTAFVGF